MSTTCTTNFSNLDKFKCENAESRLRGKKDAFLFNLTMNPQTGPNKKIIGEWNFFSSPKGKDRRKMSMVKYEKERRKALNLSIISLECQNSSLEGGGRMQRRRKRKRKRTQKRRRKKRKRRTRR